MIKVIMIAHNQKKFVKTGIKVLELYSNIKKEDIILVDNGSEDGLKEWMEQQENMDVIYCSEVESYSKIFNMAISEFAPSCDILLLNPYYMLLPHCLECLKQILHSGTEIGAVGAECLVQNEETGLNFQEAVKLAEASKTPKAIKQRLNLDPNAVLIKGEMLYNIKKFDEHLKLPHNILLDYLFRATCDDNKFYQCSGAYTFSFMNMPDIYTQFFGKAADRSILKEKWKMNYFTDDYNEDFLAMINVDEQYEMKILEVGCDCGMNLLEIRNRYPNARLYGIEINSAAAEIAKHICDVKVGNIEDYKDLFSQKYFDYIIFGDVLEHLRDPLGTISYCRKLLSEKGCLLACIPNLMHISVIHELLNGNFTYTEMGLLDKTHIHLFTYNEILRMFRKGGYEIEKIDAMTYAKLISDDDKLLIRQLVELSDEGNEIMYQAFQFFVSAKPTQNY